MPGKAKSRIVHTALSGSSRRLNREKTNYSRPARPAIEIQYEVFPLGPSRLIENLTS